ncbi:MAG: hypothetical protein KGL39_44785 [Patescibacteria group bacterium]|nr:hypothetical protein [Patescibacteria group bacterium]
MISLLTRFLMDRQSQTAREIPVSTVPAPVCVTVQIVITTRSGERLTVSAPIQTNRFDELRREWPILEHRVIRTLEEYEVLDGRVPDDVMSAVVCGFGALRQFNAGRTAIELVRRWQQRMRR